MLLGRRITGFVPPGTTIVRGAAVTVERRGGWKIAAPGCGRDVVRSSQHHGIHGFGWSFMEDIQLFAYLPGIQTSKCCHTEVIVSCGDDGDIGNARKE